MTLSASAIINGLTMLRAYNAEIRVSIGAGTLQVDGVKIDRMHADDYNRMLDEGWHAGVGAAGDAWRLE